MISFFVLLAASYCVTYINSPSVCSTGTPFSIAGHEYLRSFDIHAMPTGVLQGMNVLVYDKLAENSSAAIGTIFGGSTSTIIISSTNPIVGFYLTNDGNRTCGIM